MANRRVPKFSWSNCAQSPKKTFMCPKFCTNPVLKYTKCHISTNLSNFLKLYLLYCQKLFALAPTNRRFAEKNRLSGNTDLNTRPGNMIWHICRLNKSQSILRRRLTDYYSDYELWLRLWDARDFFRQIRCAPQHWHTQGGFQRLKPLWEIGSFEKGWFGLNVFFQLSSWIYGGMKKN